MAEGFDDRTLAYARLAECTEALRITNLALRISRRNLRFEQMKARIRNECTTLAALDAWYQRHILPHRALMEAGTDEHQKTWREMNEFFFAEHARIIQAAEKHRASVQQPATTSVQPARKRARATNEDRELNKDEVIELLQTKGSLTAAEAGPIAVQLIAENLNNAVRLIAWAKSQGSAAGYGWLNTTGAASYDTITRMIAALAAEKD